MKTYTITFLMMIFGATFSCAQDWERKYDLPGNQTLSSLDHMADGQLLLTGYTSDGGINISLANFVKTDLNGNTLWTAEDSLHGKNLDNVLITQDGGILISGRSPNQAAPSYVQKFDSLAQKEWILEFSFGEYSGSPTCQLTNGNFFVFGTKTSYPNMANPLEELNELLIHEVDANGQLISTQQLDTIRTMTTGDFTVRKAQATSDGGAILNGGKSYFDPGVNSLITLGLTIKVNAQGEEEWRKEIESEYGRELIETSNGDFMTISYTFSNNVNPTSLKRLNSVGELIWRIDFKEEEWAQSFCSTLDDNYYLVSNFYDGATLEDYSLLYKITPQGDILWAQEYGAELYAGKVLLSKTDGCAFIAAEGEEALKDDLYLIKSDCDAVPTANQLMGTVFQEEIVNCDFDSMEIKMEDIVLELENDQITYFATSDSSGAYGMSSIQEGDFALNAILPTQYTESCVENYPLSFTTNNPDTLTVDFPIEVIAECPYLEVSMGTWALRPCFSSLYSVHYENLGTIAAENAYIEITLDSLLTIDSSTLVYTELDGVYTFDIGTVDVLETGSFTFMAFLDCDAPLGMTFCAEAHIFPDSLCFPTPGWTGASIEVDGACVDGEINFSIQNVGTATTSQPITYFVVEDNVILMQDTISNLGSGMLRSLPVIDAQGASFYLKASQEPNHPGMNLPSIAILGCDDNNDPNPFGNLNIFGHNDANPFIDIDCIVSTGSYDPNDKQGLPLGVGDEHFIEQNQALEYRLRFQNVGTDTAFNVVILDTLTNLLDIPTIRPGASSHPYEFELYGAGIIKFTFPNILLPDSTTNELGSQGFVKFKIQQERDLPLGSVIENSAGIYFDFNDPVLTNTTLHTIADLFPIQVGVNDLLETENSLVVAPNPFSGSTVFTFEEFNFQEPLHLRIYDALGRLLRMETISENNYELDRSTLNQGIHFFQITHSNTPIANGKLIVN